MPHQARAFGIRDDIDRKYEAIATGDPAHVAKLYPQPLETVGDIARATICAAPEHCLLIGDFSGIESRVLAWVSGQRSKLDQWTKFDRTGDPKDEPYYIIGRRCGLSDEKTTRTVGKTTDLAFGYQGGPQAWKRIAPEGDTSSDENIRRYQQAWRNAHPQTVRFWHGINRVAVAAVRKPGTPFSCRRHTVAYDGAAFLQIGLPSGRLLSYPFPRLKTDKFGNAVVVFKDNAAGKWTDCRFGQGAYGGLWAENIVQAVSRDLLASAMLRLEAHDYRIVLHVHDEVVAEVPIAFGSVDEFQRLITALPDWAEGLPIAAKVWSGQRYAKNKAANDTQPKLKPDDAVVESARPVDGVAFHVGPTPAPFVAAPEADEEKKLGANIPLADLIGQPLVDSKITCPFHEDSTPSLHIYDDHFHCFGCGAHGDHIDWLMMVEEMARDEAVRVLETWYAPIVQPRVADRAVATRARALRLWQQAWPIAGTPAAQYLAERRRIDIAALPGNVDDVLRFHPRCPFGPGTKHPCLIALLRDIATDAPTGIHRIALAPDVSKIDRRMLGRWGAVKLWPAGTQLIVGEGIETTLAAATRISHRGAPLRPAWSAVSSGALAKLPLVAGVKQLLILVDNDLNGQGQAAAARCAERWSRAGRGVTQLKPNRPGTDFNDLIMLERAS